MNNIIKIKQSDLSEIIYKVLLEQTQPFYTSDGKFNIGGPMTKPKGAINASIVFPNIKDGKYPQQINREQYLKALSSAGQTKMVSDNIQQFLKTSYGCITNQSLSNAATIAVRDHKLDPFFVRHAMGILGRESDFGKLVGNSIQIGGIPIGNYLPSKYAIKSVPEYIMNSIDDSNPVKSLLFSVAKTLTGKKSGWVPSMGIAQMTPDVAKKYGVDVHDLMGMTGSLIASSSYLKDIYMSLTNYDTNVPSVIIMNGKIVNNPSSTGNARLDASIMSYNLGAQKFTKQYCTTNNPNYLAPCTLQNYRPLPNDQPNLILKVNQNQSVKNYTPRFQTKTGEGFITSYGYLKEVRDRANGFSCVK